MSPSGTLLLFCYFFALIAFSMLKRTALPSKALYLFRAFFPSWRFFEDFDEAPSLYYRLSSGSVRFGAWERCLERPPRRILSLLHNPQGNFVLAAGSLVQELLSDIEEIDDAREVENLVSYQLTKNLVSFQIRKKMNREMPVRFEFKISGMSGDILLSPTFELRTLK